MTVVPGIPGIPGMPGGPWGPGGPGGPWGPLGPGGPAFLPGKNTRPSVSVSHFSPAPSPNKEEHPVGWATAGNPENIPPFLDFTTKIAF